MGRTGRSVAAGIAVAGVAGLGLLALPGGAGAAPELPPVSAQDLVASVLAAHPGAFSGTVQLDNELGLPALPDVPQAANGTSTAQVWSGGDGKSRVQIPSSTGERTLVSDGTTFWSWNSDNKTVTKTTKQAGQPHAAPADPAAAATSALAKLQPTSEIAVDGTAEVAGRPAYELVLTPKPTERTLLREVRIAVDAQQRVPLQLTVLAQGSANPALQIGYTDLTFGPQDASRFTFTPPQGATVTDAAAHPDASAKPDSSTTVGDGWDTVVVGKVPAQQDPKNKLAGLGTPVNGSWGSGRLISTAVANAIVTDDGRIAMGAVPEQVLSETLSR
ncbi:MAG TPA: outer membrane lipoprotein carrier protein LolA [Pseudonocardia sp.]